MSVEEARKRLADALPHLGLAIQMAKIGGVPEGTKVMLGVLLVYPDDKGKICARFEGQQFLEDVNELVMEPENKALVAQGLRTE